MRQRLEFSKYFTHLTMLVIIVPPYFLARAVVNQAPRKKDLSALGTLSHLLEYSICIHNVTLNK